MRVRYKWNHSIQFYETECLCNPPYGLKTMTFYIGPLDAVQLVNFEHRDELD